MPKAAVNSEPLTLSSILRLLRDSAFQWSRGKAYVYAAALAFYTIFSLVPLLVLLGSLARDTANAYQVERAIIEFIAGEAGVVPAEFVGQILEEGGLDSGRNVATGLGLLFLIYGASTMFHQLQNSFNAMYGLPEAYTSLRHGVLYFVVTRLVSAALVIIVGIAFLLVLAINFILTALPPLPAEVFLTEWPMTKVLLRYGVVPLAATLFFTALYKFLPAGRMRWRDVLPGAVLTTVLVALGNRVLGFYLSQIVSPSLYGASSTVILFLTWIYYISMILLFGAKFIALYAERFGQPLTPKRRLFLSTPPGPGPAPSAPPRREPNAAHPPSRP